MVDQAHGSEVWAGGGADGGRRPPPPPSALPCQNSNNCPQLPQKRGFRRLRKIDIFQGPIGIAQRATLSVTEASEAVDHDGRAWKQDQDGTWVRTFGGLSSAERKRALALRLNVEGFAAHFERKHCGFLTLSALGQDDQLPPHEFASRWHDMRKTGRGHEGLTWLKSYVRVLEAQRRGAPHYHLLVAVDFDMRPESFDWDSYAETLKRTEETPEQYARRRETPEWRAKKRAYVESAAPELRQVWSELRKLCKHYRLGRSELLPFRKDSGALAHYVGKYLEKGLSVRKDAWKGARRVEYDRSESMHWKRCASAFGWASPGARQWRMRVGELATAVCAADLDELSKVLGPRWGYNCRGAIIESRDEDWYRLIGYLAHEHGGTNTAPGKLVGLEIGPRGTWVAKREPWGPIPNGTAEPESPAKG